MFSNLYLRLALIISISLFASCGQDVPCSEATAIIFYVSFPQNATDSVILSKYVKDNNFDSLVTTTTITTANSIYERSGDTLHIYNLQGGDYPLDINYDYDLYFPAVSKHYKLAGFTQAQTTIHEGLNLDKRGCINPVSSYSLNGQEISTSSNILYLEY